MGRTDWLGPRTGEKLAIYGVRRTAAHHRPVFGTGLAGDAEPVRYLCRRGRYYGAGAGGRSRSERLSADRPADVLAPPQIPNTHPRALARSGAAARDPELVLCICAPRGDPVSG